MAEVLRSYSVLDTRAFLPDIDVVRLRGEADARWYGPVMEQIIQTALHEQPPDTARPETTTPQILQPTLQPDPIHQFSGERNEIAFAYKKSAFIAVQSRDVLDGEMGVMGIVKAQPHTPRFMKKSYPLIPYIRTISERSDSVRAVLLDSALSLFLGGRKVVVESYPGDEKTNRWLKDIGLKLDRMLPDPDELIGFDRPVYKWHYQARPLTDFRNRLHEQYEWLRNYHVPAEPKTRHRT